MTAAFIALDDLDRVILDNRVGEQSLASLAEQRTRAAAILAIDLDVEDLALSHALDALDGERPQRPLDRLALRIEHPGFERDGNARFQRSVSGKVRRRATWAPWSRAHRAQTDRASRAIAMRSTDCAAAARSSPAPSGDPRPPIQ